MPSRAMGSAPTLAFCAPIEGVATFLDGLTFSLLWWNPLPALLLSFLAIGVSMRPASWFILGEISRGVA